MNVFYLTLNKTNRSSFSLRVLGDVGALTENKKPLMPGLEIIHDEKSQLLQLGDCSLFNLGTLVYRDQWHKKALELIVSDLIDGRTVEEIVFLTHGQFCLVIKHIDDIYIVTDRLGVFPIYKYEDSDKIEISNLLLPLARNNSVSLNRQALAESVSFYYCLDATLFNEIERLDMGTIYTFGRKHETIRYDNVFEGIEFDKYTDLREAVTLATSVLQKNTAFLTSDNKIFIDMTGGFDTRLNAILLYGRDLDFDTGICGEQVFGEIALARRVADALNVSFHSDINISERSNFDVVLQQHIISTTGVPILYHSTELINYYNYIARFFDIHITGFGGSEVMEQTLSRMRLFSSKVSKLGICMRKEWLYQDVFPKEVMTKPCFYGNLSDKLERLLNTIGSHLYYHAGNALSVLDFSRNYAGCLIGTHNAILPAYTPFLEADYFRFMLEVSYDLKKYQRLQCYILKELNQSVAEIKTSHGYSPKTGPSPLVRMKGTVRDIARQLCYGLGLFRAKAMAKTLRQIMVPPQILEYMHRRFWTEAIDEHWSEEMPIFEIISRQKLDQALKISLETYKLKAIVLYLNRMIIESQCKL
jgi:hypothetical protein